MVSNNNHLVIMAGGVGSRFWPMSTSDMPKQFIDVLGCGRTLLQLTVDRFEDICPAENILGGYFRPLCRYGERAASRNSSRSYIARALPQKYRSVYSLRELENQVS